jgi:hypothetical protein
VSEKGILQADIDEIKDSIIDFAISLKTIMSYNNKMSSSSFGSFMNTYTLTLGSSSRFKDLVISFYGKGVEDSATIMSYLTFTFADNLWTGNDLKYARIIRKVATGSNTYWSGRLNGGYQTDWDCNSWVLLVDGIGGIFGSPFGGIGGIILGTTFSIGANEDCIKRQRASGKSYF